MKGTRDLTVGNPLKGIILFTIPIILGNIFRHMYNLVDTTIVGHILGDEALAAVGATSVLYGFYTSMTYGLSNGFSIVIARYFGSRNEQGLRKTVANTIILSLAFSALLTLVGILTAKPLLYLLRTPEDIIEQSYSYVIILLICVTISMLYNMFDGILKGIGNSVMPLVFLIISTVLNAFLDYVFIAGFHMGVAGAAVATVVAQLAAVICCFVYTVFFCDAIKVSKHDFKLDIYNLKDLFTNGISMALMFSIVSLGSIALQSAINSLGAVTIAAHTAARKIGEMFMMFFTPLSVAASTFCSQNLGAGKKDRIKQGIKATFIVGFGAAALVNLVTFVTAKGIIVAITGTSNIELIETAEMYLYINLPFYFALAVLLILRSALQGLGRRVTPQIASGIELVGKFLVTALLVPAIGYLGICVVEPITWIICAILVFSDFVTTLRAYLKPETVA